MLLSEAVRRLVAERLPEAVTLLDLGRHRLRDLLEPERVSQLVIEGLPADFPPLKSLEGFPTNLPRQPNQLVGRVIELVELASLITDRDVPLITLVGPASAGDLVEQRTAVRPTFGMERVRAVVPATEEMLAMGDTERAAFLEAHETKPLQPARHDRRRPGRPTGLTPRLGPVRPGPGAAQEARTRRGGYARRTNVGGAMGPSTDTVCPPTPYAGR